MQDTSAHCIRNKNIKRIKQSLEKIPIISKNRNRITQILHQKQNQNNIDNQFIHNKIDNKLEVDISYRKFQSKYKLGDKIGQGSNGFVNQCIHRLTGIIYAVKSILMDDEHILTLKSNFIAVQQLSHPNIIKYKALYLDLNKHICYLVMQFFDYPNLCQVQLNTQEEIKILMYQLLNALQYIHQKGICHRDIKPANILYCKQKGTIKLIDFGISRRIIQRNKKINMLTIIGTQKYQAPQMFTGGGYNQEVDVWASGILLYYLIQGFTPFESQYHSQTINNIINIEPQFTQQCWNKQSSSVIDLILRMLKKDKTVRLNIQQCLKHHYFYSIKNVSHRSMTQSNQQLIHKKSFDDIQTPALRQPLHYSQIVLINSLVSNQIYHMIDSDDDDNNPIQRKYINQNDKDNKKQSSSLMQQKSTILPRVTPNNC